MKIKAEELRIGNLTYFISEKSGHRIEHKMTLSDMVSLKVGNKLFRPIPLTEEWLVKMGFELSAEDYYEKYDCVVHLKAKRTFISVGEYPNSLESQLITPLFVHSLQNLYFALTNKEL